MRSFVLFFLLLAFSLLVAALVAYPASLAVGLVAVQPFHRVMQRVAMGVALVGLIILLRRSGLANRRALGYALPRPQFIAQMIIGFGAGFILMMPLVGLLFGLGIRTLKPEFTWHVLSLLGVVAQGILTGVTVAFIEETFFRGAMQTAMTRESAPRLAILLPSLLYASVHFLGGKLRVPASQADWSSGFAVLQNIFESYSTPLALVDSFVALVAVGILLALVRARTGTIAACIGLHAGWVCVITSMRSISTLAPESRWTWLVGSYDGVIGWGALGLLMLIIAAWFRLSPAPDHRLLQTSQ